MSHATRNALYLASISQDVADSLAEIGVQMAGDHPLVAVDGRIEHEHDLDLNLDDDLDLDLSGDDDLDLDLDAADLDAFEAQFSTFYSL